MTKTLAPILFAGLAGLSAFLIGKGTLGQESAKSPDKLPVSVNATSTSQPVARPINTSANQAAPAAYPSETGYTESQPVAREEPPPPATPKGQPDLAPATTDSTDRGDATERAIRAKAVRDFSFEGITLGISLSEFRRIRPKANKNEADKKLGTVSLMILSGTATGCTYEFFDGKLYQLNILYDIATLTKMGGLTNVVARLESKIGKHHSALQIGDDAAKLEWDLSDVDRHIIFAAKDATGALLTVTDTKSANALNERRKKQAKTGFDD